ncbi:MULTISPECIES: formate dehydrogenase subunit delta [Afifella]|uniref:formate dehydrogenase subunit delta n=1 Tax=Afifella TaxID=643217 RepID=UPI000FE2AA37|nr:MULTISPECIES: formate dehydrogenase subunit delta [Afifella]MCT8267769.1 formate dehydrogenase subunit delta [Afifella sp. JA880]
MSPDKLAYMANQIATFFKSRPDHEAAAGVADHINSFWEPRMRAKLFEILDAGGTGLDPLVVEAAPMIRQPKPERA